MALGLSILTGIELLFFWQPTFGFISNVCKLAFTEDYFLRADAFPRAVL